MFSDLAESAVWAAVRSLLALPPELLGRIGAGGFNLDPTESRRDRSSVPGFVHVGLEPEGRDEVEKKWEDDDDDDEDDEEDDAPRWITLRKHVDDRSISAPGAWASWAIDAPASSTPVRFLRLVLTGRDEHAPEDEHAGRFHLCSAEFYGLLASGGKTAGRA